jgi:hypothetical protein
MYSKLVQQMIVANFELARATTLSQKIRPTQNWTTNRCESLAPKTKFTQTHLSSCTEPKPDLSLANFKRFANDRTRLRPNPTQPHRRDAKSIATPPGPEARCSTLLGLVDEGSNRLEDPQQRNRLHGIRLLGGHGGRPVLGLQVTAGVCG